MTSSESIRGLSLARKRVGWALLVAFAIDIGILALVQWTSEGYEDWIQAAFWFVPLTGFLFGLVFAYGIILFCEAECQRNEAL
jgi:hypothetical protein